MKCSLNFSDYLFHHGVTMKLSAVFLMLTTGWQQYLLEAGFFCPTIPFVVVFSHLKKKNHIKFVKAFFYYLNRFTLIRKWNRSAPSVRCK